MPIHDQTYRRYIGPRAAPGTAWSVIAWNGFRTLAGKRLFLMIMLLGWAWFVVYAVQGFSSCTVQKFDVFRLSAETFRVFFERQGFSVFIVTVYAGVGLIATDRRVHAWQIYLSKPLTRVDYVAGKLAILLVLLVTWVPATMLLLLQVLFAGDVMFLRENLFLVPAMAVFSLLYALVASFMVLVLSSRSTSPRYVAVLYAGAVLFTDAIFGVVTAVTRSTSTSWVSFRATLAQVGDVTFRMSPRYDTPWGVSLAVLVALIGLSVWVLSRRVRGVEVVT